METENRKKISRIRDRKVSKKNDWGTILLEIDTNFLIRKTGRVLGNGQLFNISSLNFIKRLISKRKKKSNSHSLLSFTSLETILMNVCKC